MPSATAPVAKPAAATKPSATKPAKPAGFTKPAGFSKPAAQDLEETEKKPTHPVIWVLVAIAFAVILFGFYKQYKIDTTPSRVTEPVMGFLAGDADSADEGGDSADEESSEEE